MNDTTRAPLPSPLPQRSLSLVAGEPLQSLDLPALFGDETPNLVLAETSAPLPDGLVLVGRGLLSGLVPARAAPLTLLLRPQDPADITLRRLDIFVRCPFVVEATWDGPRLVLSVSQNLLADTDISTLTQLSLGGQDLLDQVEQVSRCRIMRTPDGTYSLDMPLQPGTRYLLSYTVPEQASPIKLTLVDGAGGPLPSCGLPCSAGTNRVFLTPEQPINGVLFRADAPITLRNLYCEQASWSVDIPRQRAGTFLVWRVQVGAHETAGSTQVRQPERLYVAPYGEDRPDRGGPDRPFRHPGYAVRHAKPGDTIYLRPGVYPPFVVSRSGTARAPITMTTLPDETHQAIISSAGDTSFRLAGILIEAQDHIIVRNLVIEDMLLSGIFVLGRQGEIHGNHLLANNVIRRVGNAGIFVAGYLPHKTLAYDDVRLRDIVIELNDISQTNIPTPYNDFKGGVNECISVAAGARSIITRHNHIHDSRQYGIDYKHGVRDGKIYGNRIWNIERYGIYLDTARRYVEDIDIFNNVISQCGLGITLAREAVTDPDDPVQMADLVQTLRNINIYGNVIFDIERSGIYCHDHPKDRPTGTISEIRIRFNTIVNCARSGVGNEVRLVGWTGSDWTGVLRSFDFVGNILWHDTPRETHTIYDEFSGHPEVLIDQNLIDIDPQFRSPGDFRLAPDSPARNQVDARFALLAPKTGTTKGRLHRMHIGALQG
ncbi:right-handed parallel beta-helix repeat-containing protein [Roseobacter sp.]|uniref:right-handed parallel beta-helix repeat-containing protein n=1 Tax=Roseobacter sp. TaxID=1907202 RepID=UPI00385EA841